MIKYAKTKDNRIVKVDVEDGIFTSKYKIVGELKDTIEELCDQFVFTSPDLIHPELVIKMNFEYVKKTYKYTEFYAAIWTDKGLIYVAKMNKEGELELI